MSVVPVVTPVTRPVDELIVATAGVTEVHAPPGVALGLDRVILPAGHTGVLPVIVPPLGGALTVTTLVALAVPQLLAAV